MYPSPIKCAIKKQTQPVLAASAIDGFQPQHGVVIPEVGNWYRRVNGNLFEVVAVDEDERTVEMQHFDGTIEELDFEAWRDVELEPAEAPEDWSGSVDVDLEDMPEPDQRTNRGWHDPLEFLDRYE